MQWLMLQQRKPEDFVIATGRQISVRAFVELACKAANLPITWKGKGSKAHAVHTKTGKTIVAVDPRYFRPTEVETLLGDPGKAHRKLGWKPRITVQQLAKEMIAADLDQARRDALARDHGFAVNQHHE